MISADHLAQIFGIEARRQRRRTDQIAEHHGQLAPLGLGLCRYIVGCRRHGDIGQGATECGDRVKHSAAVADRRDAELAQILARQPAQNLLVNVVVAERGRILFEPKPAQPFGHIHRSHYSPGAVFCPGCLSGART